MAYLIFQETLQEYSPESFYLYVIFPGKITIASALGGIITFSSDIPFEMNHEGFVNPSKGCRQSRCQYGIHLF